MLTVAILTKNEEKNIVAVIKNAKLVAEDVLIVDSGSTDKTVEIAEQMGARVVYRAWDNDFSAQRNFALEQTSADWILYLDADERLNEEAVDNIKAIIGSNNNIQGVLKRRSVAFGRECNYGILKPDYVPRLFKKDNVHWINRVHERPVCKDASVNINGYIRHYTYTTWFQHYVKFNQYTEVWAIDSYNAGKRSGYVQAFLHAFYGIFRMMFLKLGILDGWIGLILSLDHGFYILIKYCKLIDLQRREGK